MFLLIIACRYAFQILLQMRKLLMVLPSLVDVTVPDNSQFTVCGDVHGQVSLKSFAICESRPSGHIT